MSRLKQINLAKLGFTLVELLVVIAIIGVLASIVLASLNTARRKGRDARRVADLNQIRLALELYADANGQNYPPFDGTLPGCAHSGTAAGAALGLEDLVVPPPGQGAYIPSVPRDPNSTTGAPRCYKYATVAAPVTQYHLGADIEEATNIALNGDRDCTSAAAGCFAAAAAGGGFAGGAVLTCGGAAGPDQCYDITN